MLSQPMSSTKRRHQREELAEVYVDWLIAVAAPRQGKNLETVSSAITLKSADLGRINEMASIRGQGVASSSHHQAILRLSGFVKVRYKGLLKNDKQWGLAIVIQRQRVFVAVPNHTSVGVIVA